MHTSYWQTLRSFGRDVRLFLVAAFLSGFAFDGMRTVLFNLYLLRLGFGPEFVGVVNATGALVFAGTCLPAGALGSRFGSRRMLIVGLALMSLGLILQPAAEVLPMTAWAGWLLFTTMLAFMGMALYLVNSMPYLMLVAAPAERAYVFSAHIAATPLAAFAGSLIGGALPVLFAGILSVTLANSATYRYPLLLATLALAPALVALTRTGPEPAFRPVAPAGDGNPDRQPEQQADATPAPVLLFLVVALVMALRFGGRGPVNTFFNVYLDTRLGVSTVVIGLLVAVSQLLSVPAALAAPVQASRWGARRLITWGTVGMGLVVIPLALIPNWAVAGLAFLASLMLFAVTAGPFRVFTQELVAPRWRPTMSSSFMMGASLAFATVTLLGGYGIVALGYPALFLLAAGLSVAGGLLFWFYFRVPRGEMAKRAGS